MTIEEAINQSNLSKREKEYLYLRYFDYLEKDLNVAISNNNNDDFFDFLKTLIKEAD